MSLIKTSALSFLATAVKMLSLLVINKVVALTIGPTGVALIGQFQNFSQVAMTAAQGGVNQGLIKYTAEYKEDEDKLTTLFSTAVKIYLVCSFIVGFSTIIFAEYLSIYFLDSSAYKLIFILFGVFLPLYVINQALLAILNGLNEIRLFISNNIIQSIYSLVFTSVLAYFFELNGALIAMVTNQSVVLLILLWRVRGHALIRLNMFKARFSIVHFKGLLGFAAMSLSSIVAVPLVHLFIRGYIGENLSWEAAGYWQSMWYISTMYLMVITTALGVYYLPRLSELKDKKKIKTELRNGYKIIMPVVLSLSIAIYLLHFYFLLSFRQCVSYFLGSWLAMS